MRTNIRTFEKKKYQDIKNIPKKERNKRKSPFINELEYNKDFLDNSLDKEEENEILEQKKQDKIYFKQRSFKYKTYKDKNSIKKTNSFVFFFKKQKSINEKLISYTNMNFLKIYLTKYGKIRSHFNTRLKIRVQVKISKMIRRARSSQLVPLKFNVKY